MQVKGLVDGERLITGGDATAANRMVNAIPARCNTPPLGGDPYSVATRVRA